MAAALLRKCRGAQSSFISEKSDVIHRAVHTSVWWDFYSVPVPKGCDYSRIAGNITDALAKLGYSAPVTFSAYGVTYLLDDEESHALSSTGIKLTTAYNYRKEPHLSSKEIIRDIWAWTKDYPAPANYLFITADRELSFSLHQLAMQRYNILLATTRDLHDMEAAASTIWRWRSLLAGCPPERRTK